MVNNVLSFKRAYLSKKSILGKHVIVKKCLGNCSNKAIKSFHKAEAWTNVVHAVKDEMKNVPFVNYCAFVYSRRT